MKITDFKIPVALQIVVDDIGWFWGRDDREIGGPSRTGVARTHILEDYIVLNEIGRALNQKINAMLVIGEWDINNRLRKVPHCSNQGENWNGSFWLNKEEAEKIRNFLNTAEFIEIGFHGLLHSTYSKEGELLCCQEFMVNKDFKKENERELVPENITRAQFDTFFEIYNDWGFTQKIQTFASPGNIGDAWKTDEFSNVIKDYGIKFWHNNVIRGCSVQSGIILNPKAVEICPWFVYDFDPLEARDLKPEEAGIIGSHWANYLRFNPKKSIEGVKDWKTFYDRQSEIFGMIISRDIEFAHYQQLYKNYAVISEENDCIKIDLSEADKIAPEKNMPIYISLTNEPSECTGGKLSLYETKSGFKNYKVERTGDSIIYIK